MLDTQDFKAHFQGVAEARYVIRKVFRIVDDGAKKAGLDPLEHQALIQIFASREPVRVIALAERLDIPPTFASRLAINLEEKGFASRSRSREDRRTTIVEATDAGRGILGAIDRTVSIQVDNFMSERTDAQRASALGVLALYVGAPRIEDLPLLIEKIASSSVVDTTTDDPPRSMQG
jgi:DNA-binding MarR family transcriptional regulator